MVIVGDTRHSEETFSVSKTISCQTDYKPHLRLSGDFTSLSNKLCKQSLLQWFSNHARQH